MSEMLLLLGLLVAAYFGSVLVEGTGIRGFGLPSGSEWLVLGVLLGPHALGVFEASVIHEFKPLVVVGLGWLALVVGIDYGYVGERRITWKGLSLGLVLPALSGAPVFALVYWYTLQFMALSAHEARNTALALALVSSETTRHAVRWVNERYGAEGPLATLLAEISDADDAVPLLGLMLLIAWVATPNLSIELSVAGRVGLTLGLGVVLGLIAAALLAKSLAFGESWTVLIGAALLGIGVSMGLGSSALTVLFITGAVISLVSHRHAELRRLLAPTERPVALPLFLLGGASLNLHAVSETVLVLLLLALAVRVLAKIVSGWLVAVFAAPARKSPSATGAALLASGTLTMSIGLYGYLNLERALGETVLLLAALTTVVGEVVSPWALRRALERAGETLEQSEPVALGEEAS